jgi:hypothetical protein
VDSNNLSIGSTTERMEPVPAVAPAQGEVAAQNQQNQPRRHASPAEPAPEVRETDREPDSASDSDTGSNPDHAGDSDKEDPEHRVDSMA